jgi:ABC-2 type transport system ATP-binding protein
VRHAIEAVGVEKTYRGWFGRPQVALERVDLRVPEGTIFGLIGLNGAGKTTFIKSMLGVVRPTGGEVHILGGDPEDPEIRRRVGYLPERLYFPHSWSGRAFLASVARLKRLPASKRGSEIDRQLFRVELTEDSVRSIGSYSKGMKQRLGLAAALLGEPELLVLDEPSDGVDPLGRQQIRGILEEEKSRGATIFLNSHLLSETERVSDRIAILHRGRVVLEGSLDELVTSRTQWTVRFERPVPEGLEAIGFRPAAEDRFTIEANDADRLNEALDRARVLGAKIVELVREVRDLEEILAEVVAK